MFYQENLTDSPHELLPSLTLIQTMDMLDVLIIGGGPIGLAAGIECEKAGLKYLIVEKGVLVNSIYHYPYNMTFFSTSDKLEIGEVPFISHNTKPTRTEALEYYRRVAESWKLKIKLYEKVIRVTNHQEHFKVNTSKSTYAAKNVVLTTGFYDEPHLMKIPGETLQKVHHYYRDPHPYFRQKIIVVGAANSAVDAALETYRKGADVTVVVREEEISPKVKYWVRPDLINRIEEGSIKAFFNSTLKEIKTESVIVEDSTGNIIELENDFVLAMTGYEPDFALIRSLGVDIADPVTKAPVYNEQTMETNAPGVYVAGVVCGGLETNKWFIENSRIHAKRIVDQISGKNQINT